MSDLTVKEGELIVFLWKQVFENIRKNENGHYFASKVTNNKSPMILSQVRIILVLCSNNLPDRFESDFLIKSMTNYLISMRDSKRGLFNFNQSSWDLQDEGIASVWATLALIKAFEKTNEKVYLETAISTMQNMLVNLYSKETSLLHTEGENFWCLNAASTFANASALILEHYYSEDIKTAMIDSINLCLDKIASDGHYPYNLKRLGTYLLLYHPIVMITLNNCLESKYISGNLRRRIISANERAEDFLLTCIDDHNRIYEPEIKHYNQYIITNVTTLLALKGKISKDRESELYKNISTFLKNEKLFLCKDRDNKLFDSDLYRVKDVLSIEVLYWLDIYKSD